MHLFLLALHVGGIIAAAWAGRRSMRLALAAAGIAPAAAAAWAATLMVRGTDSSDSTVVTWVDRFDITFRFTSGPVALMMTLLVSGIGALVFVYAAGYFAPTAKGATNFPATLLAFSASMLGLVWADSVWTLFIFWEFTSVTSFLLVGYKNTDAAVLASARRALMITGAGGLVLLAGLLLLASEAGTTTISQMEPVAGSTAALAAILVMVGAATKSAQVPFHVWLPGAMAAPTPVSAYLHSATMVKAGVLLIALVGRLFTGSESNGLPWGWLGIAFGTASVFWGAIGALRHTDAKLILAWGTVSQLGLMITLLSVGSGKAVFAATSIVFAHAIFKAALFMIVGEIDIRTGTRQIAELGGLARSMPVAFGVAVVSGLSMAGVPPLLGFAAKEAAIEAVLKLSGAEQIVVGATVIGGSVLTVAYTTRFLVAVFGAGPATKVAPRRLLMTVPAVTLAALSLVGFVLAPSINKILTPAASVFNPDSSVYELIRWPGLKTAFVISIAIMVVGGVLGWILTGRKASAPAPIGANLADRTLDGILIGSREVTAVVQHGSLPVYLATMISVAVGATVPFVFDGGTSHLVLWNSPLQGLVVAGILGSALAGAFVNSRLGAALALGAVGTGMSALFFIQGAPDLALTQLLVETIIVVGFVIGLGHLGREFPPVQTAWKTVRIVISLLAGTGVALALAAAGRQPVGSPPLQTIAEQSVETGGGNNIVNVILTDLRALDTLGEVVVLATVAFGVAALARARHSEEVAS